MKEIKNYIKNVAKRNNVKIYLKDIISVKKVYHHSNVGAFVNNWFTYTAVLNDKVVSFVSDGYSVESFNVEEL